MIFANKGHVQFDGTVAEVLADLTTIIRSMKGTYEASDSMTEEDFVRDLADCGRYALMSNEEMVEAFREKIMEVVQ